MPVVGSKRKLDGTQRYSELSIPTTPDLLRVKRRERLQLSTSAARHTATTSAPSPPSPTEYTIRLFSFNGTYLSFMSDIKHFKVDCKL